MESQYYPPRRKGLITILFILVILIGVSLTLLLRSSQELQSVYSLPGIVLGIFLGLLFFSLLYRAFEISTTRYTLSRSALEIHWGLREELLPLQEIDWMRPGTDFEARFPTPLLSLPGSIFGKRNLPGLGVAEFAATDKTQFILIAAGKRFFVISPTKAGDFLRQFSHESELGSLERIQPRSESFGTLWQQVIHNRSRRLLLAAGGVAVLLLWAAAVLITSLTPTLTWVSLEVVTSSQIYLLPTLGTIIWLVNLALGLIFFRSGAVDELRIRLLWAGSILTSLVLLAAMVLMTF